MEDYFCFFLFEVILLANGVIFDLRMIRSLVTRGTSNTILVAAMISSAGSLLKSSSSIFLHISKLIGHM